MKKPTALLLSGALLLLLACSKSNSDAVNNTPGPIYDLVRAGFTVAPFDTAEITGLVPLGNLNPPAHVFPSDHMYFYCFTGQPALNIKSPGNVRINRIGRTRYNAGTANDHYDYNICMGADNSYLYYSHVSNLSAKLLAAINNFAGAKCNPPYTTGGTVFEQCYVTTTIMAAPGEILGTAIPVNNWAVMDFGISINGIGGNPLDYFNAATRSMLEAKLGRYDGKAKRTVLPLSGEIDQDIIASAQGSWVKQGGSRSPEDNNIALVKDNIDPAKQAFSVGNSLPGLPSNVYYFVPQSSGFVNRHFAEVKADANTYCYTLGVPNFPFAGNSLLPGTSIIIRLDNSNTLSVEKRNCDCNCAPYTFGSNKVVFTR